MVAEPVQNPFGLRGGIEPERFVVDEIDYDEVCNRYMQKAEGVYRYYWKEEINDVERGWLRDCWQAISENDAAALQELQNDTLRRKNRTIRVRLAKLGLVLSESGAIELPAGFQSFLEKL